MPIRLRHKVAIIFFLTLFLGACSVKTIYNQLDWVLLGMIEDYVTLTSAQTHDVEKRVDSFFHWHQYSQLPGYADDMRKIKQYVTTGLDQDNTEQIFDMMMSRWEALKKQVAPEMADLLLQLSDRQRKEMFATLKEKNQEIAEEYAELTTEERTEKARENLEEGFEDWLGDLNEYQVQLLHSWPENFRTVHYDRLAFRIRWQEELKTILSGELPREEKYRQLLELILHPDRYQTPEHREKLVYNSKQIKRLMLEFDPTLTQQQRKHLAERLDYFIRNFEELAAEEKS